MLWTVERVERGARLLFVEVFADMGLDDYAAVNPAGLAVMGMEDNGTADPVVNRGRVPVVVIHGNETSRVVIVDVGNLTVIRPPGRAGKAQPPGGVVERHSQP